MKRKILIIGESNSVYRDGWVAGFTRAVENTFEVENRSIGSTGIFNVILQLCQIGQELKNYDAVVLDTCIQDAFFFMNRLNAYFSIIGKVFEYLTSTPIFTCVVQFENLARIPKQSEFYERVRHYYHDQSDCYFHFNDLIAGASEFRNTKKVTAAYTDNHHIHPLLASRIGENIGRVFLDKFHHKENSGSAPKIADFFYFLDAEQLSQGGSGELTRLKNSLIDFRSVTVGLQASKIEIPPELRSSTIIGVIFNATRSNGILEIASDTRLHKNFSNSMRRDWKADLVWARCLHSPVRLGQYLSLQALTSTTELETTEHCSLEAYSNEVPTAIQVIGFILDSSRSTHQTLFAKNGKDSIVQFDVKLKTQLTELFNAGQFDEVVEISRNVTLSLPDNLFIWKVLSGALVQLGRHQEASHALENALKISNRDAEIHNMQAANLQALGRFIEAERHFHTAIKLKGDYVEAYFNLGELYFNLNRLQEAHRSFQQALVLRPNFILAKTKLAITLHSLGAFENAKEIFGEIVLSTPDSFEAHSNLGKTLMSQGKVEVAEQHFRTSVELNPHFVEGLSNLSNLLAETQRYEESERISTIALKITPHHIGALNNRALALRGLGRLVDAENTLRHAVRVAPDVEDVKMNLALILLSRGNFDEAWQLHESRYHEKNSKRTTKIPNLKSTKWTTESIVGKTLLILPEQGLGDQIQFIRYIKLIKDLKPRQIYFSCVPALFSLFQILEDETFKLIPSNSAYPEHDLWTYLLSIPQVLGTKLETIPQYRSYLQACNKEQVHFKNKLASTKGIKLGICWSGSKLYKFDEERSIGITPFEKLKSVPGIQFFCLQNSGRTKFLETFGQYGFDLEHEIDEFTEPFEETAALISNMDLIISCDTAIGHLAGALGKQVWLLLPYVADWRWMTQRDDTPWYPNTRLFRQNDYRSWPQLMDRVVAELSRVVGNEKNLLD